MRNIPIYLIALMTLMGCHKNEENPASPVVNIENIQIFLDSNLRTIKIIKTSESNKFLWETNFNYTDSIIRQTTSYADSDYSVIRYKIGNNGFAMSSIDTFFRYSTHIMNTDSAIYFSDVNGYLTSVIENYNTLNYNYINGDLNSVINFDFTYFDTLEKIDIFFDIVMPPYGNGIIGKVNKHLFKKITWTIAHAPPIIYNFEYSIDSNGYVSEQKETYLAGQYTYYYLKRYTYIFNYAP
jgi:hypothetical protein